MNRHHYKVSSPKSFCRQRFILFCVLLCLTQTIDSLAQNFYYAPFENNVYLTDVSYIIGRQGNNILVWLYRYKSRTLCALLYTPDMKLVSRQSVLLHGIDQFNSFSFLKKTSGRDIILQYINNGKAITRQYSFDEASNNIKPGNILDESDIYTQLIIKQSADNIYTGFVKGYKTTDDSLLIEYSLTAAADTPFYHTTVILPFRNRSFNLAEALVDNEGSLFFYTQAISNNKDTQTIELYQVSSKKDSLFTSQLTRQGAFWGVHIRISDVTGLPCLSGLLTEPVAAASGSSYNSSRSFFLQPVKSDLSDQRSIIQVPLPSALGSTQFPLSGWELTGFVETKDSSYLFYLGGLQNGRYQGNLFNKSAPLSFRSGSSNSASVTVQRYYESPYNSPFPFGAFVPYRVSVTPTAGHAYSMSEQAVSGENIFSVARVSRDRQYETQVVEDSSQNGSFPGYHMVMNTGRNIHYLYTRSLKNKKQLMYDVIASKDGSTRIFPLYPQSSFQVLLDRGTQVSTSGIIFPYLNHERLSFVRLNLE